MRTESVDEEYPNPLGKDVHLGKYVYDLMLKTCGRYTYYPRRF